MPFLTSERWVATGLLWAAIAFPLTLLVGWFGGEAIAAEDVMSQAGLWAAAGLTFGQTLRFASRRSLPGAR